MKVKLYQKYCWVHEALNITKRVGELMKHQTLPDVLVSSWRPNIVRSICEFMKHQTLPDMLVSSWNTKHYQKYTVVSQFMKT